jgi:S-formylglutathione hydrolase FrmB
MSAKGRVPRRLSASVHRRRRAALLAAAAVALTAVAIGLSGAHATNSRGATIIHYTVSSVLAHQELAQTAIVPAGASRPRRPLLVFLHGKGENQESNVSQQLFDALASLGQTAPDVVFPYGGEDSYWHDRADGAWGRYVIKEVIPEAIRRLHADPRRVAIGGLSMGGFGAYDIARLDPGAFCAVGGHSAALWLTGGESAQGAFDSDEDFNRHDVIGAARTEADPYPGAKLWLDVGSSDPFRAADTSLARALHAHELPLDPAERGFLHAPKKRTRTSTENSLHAALNPSRPV